LQRQKNNYNKMKKDVPVSSIMTPNVFTLCVSDSLEKAEKLFREKKIRHIPVMNQDKVVGMLSYTDLLKISIADTLDQDEEVVDVAIYDVFSIAQVMEKKMICITPNTTIKEAAEILSNREFHVLPVIENENLVGILTTTDLIRYLVNQYQR